MELDEYARIADSEDGHWWYRNMRTVCADLLGPWLGTQQTLLDAGCGPGGNGAWLAQHGWAIGIDRAPAALALVARHHPALHPVHGDLTTLPFRDASFEAVLAVTVLYAIPDDAAAVCELARVTKPGGAVLLVEPAFAALRRAHDTTVHGVHRYRRHQLAALADGAGLHVERSTYLYSFLTPPAALLAAVDRWNAHRSQAPAPTFASDVERRSLDRVFAPLAALERRWLRRYRVPFGTSVALLATRSA
jgi:SAM-dependent methyltransferase